MQTQMAQPMPNAPEMNYNQPMPGMQPMQEMPNAPEADYNQPMPGMQSMQEPVQPQVQQSVQEPVQEAPENAQTDELRTPPASEPANPQGPTTDVLTESMQQNPSDQTLNN